MIVETIRQIGRASLSCLEAAPRRGEANATVIALPGGGYSASYWHHPLAPAASLLQLGSALGYRVIAVDRPGYGASAALGGVVLKDQAEILADLLDVVGHENSTSADVFLIGHSMGGVLALMVAALQRTPRLRGFDVSGVPHRYSDDLALAVDHELAGRAAPSAELSAASLFYGPAGAYDARLLKGGDTSSRPVPQGELADALSWPAMFPEVAARIAAPVQYTLGEFERTTPADPLSLEMAVSRFSASPRAIGHRQLGAGHNVSLHHVARAYHLRAFAFFDECLSAPVPSGE